MTYCLLNDILLNRFVQAFCWTLIHSLWLGLILTILTGGIMVLTKKSRSSFRYNLLLTLLVFFLAVCITTFFTEWFSFQNRETESIGAFVSNNLLSQIVQKFVNYFTTNASIIVLVWFLIFSMKFVRMMGGLVYTQRIRQHRNSPTDYEWTKKLNSLCKQLELKKTVLMLESELVKIPIVLGHLKPIIFVPLGLFANIPAGQMEAVLIHELAHIKRNDYIVNLIQYLAETIFFFNPGLLWISGLLREERENCCDDIALQVTKNRKEFVEALVAFKEYSLINNPIALAFPSSRDQLFQRVSRIVHEKNKSLNPAEKLFSLVSVVLLSVLITVTLAQPNGATTKGAPVSKQNVKKEQGPLIPPGENYSLATRRDSKKYVSQNQNKATNHKPLVISIYRKVITDGVNAINDEKGMSDFKEPDPGSYLEVEKNNSYLDRIQAVKDRESADQEKMEALRDEQEAEKDRKQSLIDQKRAVTDLEQARADQVRSQIDMRANLNRKKTK